VLDDLLLLQLYLREMSCPGHHTQTSTTKATVHLIPAPRHPRKWTDLHPWGRSSDRVPCKSKGKTHPDSQWEYGSLQQNCRHKTKQEESYDETHHLQREKTHRRKLSKPPDRHRISSQTQEKETLMLKMKRNLRRYHVHLRKSWR